MGSSPGQARVPAERALRARRGRGGQPAGSVRRDGERRRHGAYLECRHPTGRADRDRRRVIRINCTASPSAPAASSSSRRAATAQRASGRRIEEIRSPFSPATTATSAARRSARPDAGFSPTATTERRRVWDSGTAAELRVLARQRAPFTGLDVFGDGRRCVTTDADGVARNPGREAAPPGHFRLAACETRASAQTAVSVATASTDGTVRIWCTRRAETRFATRKPCRSQLRSAPTGGAWRRQARGRRAWAFERRARVRRSARAGPDTVDLSFSPDGAHLVTAGADGKARIWNVATGRLERDLVGHRDRLTSARFSPDGTLVVTASADHDARVWDARTGHMRVLLRGHGAIVQDAAFSSDGRWIVTAGPGTAGLWEVRTGHLLSLLRRPCRALDRCRVRPGRLRRLHGGQRRDGQDLRLRGVRAAGWACSRSLTVARRCTKGGRR